MSKKIESLVKLKDVISKQGKLAEGFYCDGDGKNCAIGHLLKLANVSDYQLTQLDRGGIGIKTIIDASLNPDIQIEDDFVARALTELGFDLDKDKSLLNAIQNENDNGGGHISSIRSYIDEIINSEIEKENKQNEGN